MRRRVALRNIALSVGGLIALPAWANNWHQESVQLTQPFLSPRQEKLLTTVVDTILPVTDTPGAKDLNVHGFVQKMLADCYEKEVQDNFRQGLDTLDSLAKQTFNKSFGASDTTQRIELLKMMELATDANQKEFFTLVKKLTVQGYTTSEYYLTKHTNYNMIPGHFYGCVPAPSPITSTK